MLSINFTFVIPYTKTHPISVIAFGFTLFKTLFCFISAAVFEPSEWSKEVHSIKGILV